jgi:carbon-monoxide dehydrogenase small subunit
MTINFILNGEDVVVHTNAETRLIDILRDTFNLLGAKAGCYTGNCGACSILLDGEVVKACLIPAFKIQDREIVTFEGFSQTDEYQDIIQASSEAGLENCDFCNTGKILAMDALLTKNLQPSRDEILAAFQGMRCRCTDPGGLIRAVTAVVKYRKRRLYGRSS